MIDVHGQLLGDHRGRAGDLDLVDVLHDHAAFAHAGRLAAQLDRHADLDDLVLGNPREIDVDDVRPPRVPLKSRMKADSLTAPVRLTSRLPCRMAAVRASAATLSGTLSRPCPYRIARNLARLPKPPVAVFSLGITRFNS